MKQKVVGGCFFFQKVTSSVLSYHNYCFPWTSWERKHVRGHGNLSVGPQRAVTPDPGQFATLANTLLPLQKKLPSPCKCPQLCNATAVQDFGQFLLSTSSKIQTTCDYIHTQRITANHNANKTKK